MTAPHEEPHDHSPSLLNHAASILVHVGRNVDDHIDPAALAHCMQAADYLISAGANPDRVQRPILNHVDAVAAIKSVLDLFARMPAAIAHHDVVLDAVAETRTALVMALPAAT